MKHDRLWRICAIASAVGFLIYLIFSPTISEEPLVSRLAQGTVYRAFGSAVFLSALLYLGYRVFGRCRKGSWKVFLPALMIAVNNLPILALVSGAASVTKPELIWLFALECLLIGLFEELTFRGVLFPLLLENRRSSTRAIFWTTAFSSALFGLIHLINLLEGAGIGATLLQVGYSFLIGGMCAIVLLKTGNLLLCILLHAVYDFCGGLIPTIGAGKLWDTLTVILTAILAVLVTVYMVWTLLRIKPEETDFLYDSQ
jgi:membrane protease YdiL (CAAX protease family)